MKIGGGYDARIADILHSQTGMGGRWKTINFTFRNSTVGNKSHSMRL